MSSAKKWLSALIPTHNLAMIVLDPALQPCAAHVAALTKCGLRVETAERDNAPRFAPFLSRGAAPTGKPGQGSALVVLGSHRLPALASAAAWRDATDCALEELGLRPPGAAAAGDRHCPAVLVGWGDAEERSDGEELAAAQLARVGSMDDVVAGLLRVDNILSPSSFAFGPYRIFEDQVFAATTHSLAITNIRPIVPGHALVISRRPVPRVQQLLVEELRDMWSLAQTVGVALQEEFSATSMTFNIQDGRDAGQTVPHVHIHVMPRRPGDFQRKDEIYAELDSTDVRPVFPHDEPRTLHVDPDLARTPRGVEDMGREAARMREALRGYMA